MLNHISPDTVREIAEIAAAARAHQEVTMSRMQIADPNADRAPGERGAEAEEVLYSELDNPLLDRLKDRLQDLAPEARQELRAIMLVGRGDFAAREWDAALSQAEGEHHASEVDRIAENVGLHDFLTKGLYELKLA
jgi:hypothetical protein